jgi:RHS repeat-associated protein
LDHDGRQVVLLVAPGFGSTNPVALMAATFGNGSIGFGTPFYLQDQHGNNLPLADEACWGGSNAVLADLNGDGLPDLVQVVKGEIHVYIRTSRLPDVITKVVEGMTEEHTITWEPISNPDIHQALSASAFPTVSVKNGIWVVSDVASPDAAGGTRHFSYNYTNGRADALGRGWLGFEQRQETDSATAIVSTTTFDNSTRNIWQQGSVTSYAYPFVGLPQTESFAVTLDNGDSFSGIRTTTYQCISSSDSPPYTVLATQVLQKVFDASAGASGPISQITTTYDYDSNANPWRVSRVTGDGYSSVTDTTYYPDPDTNWLIGVPTQVVETQQTPSGESVMRTTKYDIDSKTGSIMGRTIEPTGDSSVQLSLQLTRENNTGLITSVQEASADQQRSERIFYDNIEHAWPGVTLNSLNQIEQYAFHPSFGVLAAFQDENNNLTMWQIDGFGRRRTELPPDGAQTTISYSDVTGTDSQYKITLRLAGGQEIQSFVDQLGLERKHATRGFDGRQIWIDKGYDSAGRLSSVTNPYFDVPTGSTSMTYDALGRLRIETNPDGSTIERVYRSLTMDVWDENRNLRIISTDQLSRPILISEKVAMSPCSNTDGSDIRTQFVYGPFGVLESMTDPAGNKIEAKYDVRGRRTLLVDPDSGSQITAWNAFDEVVSETNGLGDLFQYTRDLLGRAFSITSKEGTATIVWDQAANGIGKIANATSTDAITTIFSYDNLSRVSSEEVDAEGKWFLFSYGYDPFGRLKTIQYPAPEVAFDVPPFTVSYDYTDYGDVKDVNDATSAAGAMFWQNTARNEFEQITGEVFGNGVSTTRSFDVRARLWSLETNAATFPVQSLIYQHYPNGNLQSRTDRLNHVVEGYSYDDLDRLTQWSVYKNDTHDLTQQFCYDDIGNLRSRLTLYGNGDNLTYEYSGIHAGPHAVTSINGAKFDYDAAGRERSAPGRNTEYKSWGLPRRIVGSKFTDRFKYDFREQRTLKLRSDGTRVATTGLFQRVSKGNTLGTNTYFVAVPSRVVAAVVWDETSGRRSVYFLHDDKLGSIADITEDPSRGGVDARAFDPFGTTREATDPSVSAPPSSLEPLGYTERELDPEVELLNMLGRLYDPKFAHFTTPDPFVGSPFSSQGYNAYSYVLNNPLRWTDPTGLQEEEEEEGSGPTEVDSKDVIAPTTPTPAAPPPPPQTPTDAEPIAGTSDDNLGAFQPELIFGGDSASNWWASTAYPEVPPLAISPSVSEGPTGVPSTEAPYQYQSDASSAPAVQPPPNLAVKAAKPSSFDRESLLGGREPGYSHSWYIGPSSPLVTPEKAMAFFKGNPNLVFPFEVYPLENQKAIVLGAKYDLRSVMFPKFSNNNPVRVFSSGPTSFSFITLPGHFRGPGQFVGFRTFAEGGNLYLEQTGTSEHGFTDWFFDVGAYVAWQQQAENLKALLYGGERADFPGVWPSQ